MKVSNLKGLVAIANELTYPTNMTGWFEQRITRRYYLERTLGRLRDEQRRCFLDATVLWMKETETIRSPVATIIFTLSTSSN